MNTEKVDYTKYHTIVKAYHKKWINTYKGQWSNIVNDQSALLYIIEKCAVKSICEIGTWEGYTSLLMWQQPSVTKMKAIDICQNYKGGGAGYHHDLDKYGKYFVDITPIVLEKADTTKYICKAEDVYDMVYIDANHSYNYVKNDATLASKMSANIIAFHDYHNHNPEVDIFLNELSKKLSLTNIAGSSVTYCKSEDFRETLKVKE